MAHLTEEEKNDIAEKNMTLVHFVANKFRNTKLHYEDLFGAALLGFTKALNAFDTERGAKFSTYAVNCMKNEVRFFLRKERRQSENTVSYNMILAKDKNGNDFELHDIIADRGDGSVEIEDMLILTENREAALRAVEQLTELERYIINHRYRLNGYEFKTQKTLAAEIDMSQANVSKIEKNCIKKMGLALAGEYGIDEVELEAHYDRYAS